MENAHRGYLLSHNFFYWFIKKFIIFYQTFGSFHTYTNLIQTFRCNSPPRVFLNEYSMAHIWNNEDTESFCCRSLCTERQSKCDLSLKCNLKVLHTIILYLNILAIFHHSLEAAIMYKPPSRHKGKMTCIFASRFTQNV